jgi:two-component system sensor histidine kinase BaeS
VREQGGLGLGLSICQMIAEAHGGTIALSTPPGGGTRVELVLPAQGRG